MSFRNGRRVSADDLLAARRECLAAARGILETAKQAGRDLTDGESAEAERLTAEAKSLKAQWDNSSQKQWSTPVDPAAGLGPSYPSGPTGRSGGKTYSAMFGAASDNGGFSSFGEYLAVIDSNRYDARLRAGMIEGEGSTGGFLVPEQYAAMLLDRSLESEIVRPRAMVHPMTSDKLSIAGFDNLDHSSTLYGGFTAQWVAEGQAATEQTAKVRKIVLRAKKLFLLTESSNELVADARDFENLLGSALIAATGWHLDYACLRGTGAGQPKGVLNDAALITVDAEDGQTAETITYTNLVNMLARLHPACFSNAVWVANPTTLPQLMQLSVDLGSSSEYVPVLTGASGTYQLMYRPILFTEKMPALGTKGDILLSDFSQYSIGLRREIAVEKSAHAGFSSDVSYYRAILRADGMGRWASPITPRNGDTLSWCVALADRLGE